MKRLSILLKFIYKPNRIPTEIPTRLSYAEMKSRFYSEPGGPTSTERKGCPGGL